MANSRKSTRKTGNVTQLPGPSNAVDVAEPQEEDKSPAEAPTEAAPPPPTPSLPPKKTAKDKDGPTADPNFFQRLKSIPMNDWGSRVYLYLYVLEPLCNLKQSGGKSYLNRYSEPVQDEHQIMLEYGSGRYRLMLAQNKVSPEGSNEIARHEFEIMNKNYPPTIPRAAWINDSRNAKWEAMLPKEPQAGSATAASTIVEAMKMVGDIRRDVREELDPGEPTQTRTSEVLDTMRAAKELFGAPTSATTATPPADPFDTAAKIMAMRANDPMMAVMMELLKNANTANEASRQREYELLKAQTNPAPAKTIVDQLLEIATNAEKLKPLKEIFGFGAEAVVTRASRTTGMDILNNLVSGPAGAALAQGIGQLLMAAPSMLAGNPANALPMQPPPVLQPQVQTGPPPPENPEQRINRIGAMWTRPLISEFFMKNAPGDVFAESMWDVAPDDYVFLKSFGAENLVDRYRRFPQAWTAISYRPPTSPGVTSEQEFIKFMEAFCAWEPPKDEVEQTQAATDGVEDLDDKEEVEVS